MKDLVIDAGAAIVGAGVSAYTGGTVTSIVNATVSAIGGVNLVKYAASFAQGSQLTRDHKVVGAALATAGAAYCLYQDPVTTGKTLLFTAGAAKLGQRLLSLAAPAARAEPEGLPDRRRARFA